MALLCVRGVGSGEARRTLLLFLDDLTLDRLLSRGCLDWVVVVVIVDSAGENGTSLYDLRSMRSSGDIGTGDVGDRLAGLM